MKKQTFLFIAALLLCAMQTSQAQGEWKWAHYWTGSDGSYSDYFNKITNTAFDNDGNIYVYGTMGGNAQYDGIGFQYTNDASVITCTRRSILLAKFDSLGNMLWHKVMKTDNNEAVPLWMEVKNNKVCVAAECGFIPYNYNNSWLYYWDTVIYKYQVDALPQELQKPPFKAYCRWTCFAQFDLDGHLLDDHFVQAFSRESYFTGSQWVRNEHVLTESTRPTPVHWDSDGNVYIFTPITYWGTEDEPYTILVDVDSNKTYNLYFPGHVDTSATVSWINNAIMYKFSPNGELLASKLLVDHTDGIAFSYVSTGDSINKYYNVYYNGISFDENDNMYLTGYVQLGDWAYGYGGELHDYPVHIWWDSTHCMTLNDISSAQQCNFIIKYNTKGEVVWSNQVYTQIQQSNDIANVKFYRSCAGEDAVYVCGDAGNFNNTGSVIYFEQDTSKSIGKYSASQQSRAFYAAFDKNTGAYIKNDILPHERHSILAITSATPSLSYNQLFMFAITNIGTHNVGLARWDINGSFIDYHPTNSFPTECIGVGPTAMNDDGDIVVSLVMKGSVQFDENVSINSSSGLSSAVLALYHNPEFAHPFVADDSVDVDTYYQNREQDIYVYPNPTEGKTVVCGYMYDYRNIEIFDLQGRKVGESDWVELDLSAYPAGTYIIRINFNRSVSVTRKVVKK